MMAWRISARWQCHCLQHMGALLGMGPELSNVPTSLRPQVLQLLHLGHFGKHLLPVHSTIPGCCWRYHGAECILITHHLHGVQLAGDYQCIL